MTSKQGTAYRIWWYTKGLLWIHCYSWYTNFRGFRGQYESKQFRIRGMFVTMCVYIYDRLKSLSIPQIGIHWRHKLSSRSDLRVFSNRLPFQIVRSMSNLLVRAHVAGRRFENLKNLRYRCLWRRNWTWIWGLDVD